MLKANVMQALFDLAGRVAAVTDYITGQLLYVNRGLTAK